MSDAATTRSTNLPSAFARLVPVPTASVNLAHQIEDALAAKPVEFSSISELPTIVWTTRRFVLEQHLNSKRSKGRRSWITLHGTFLAELDGRDAVKNVVWCCRYCARSNQPQFFVVQSTSSSIKHLQETHLIREDTSTTADDVDTPSSVLGLQTMAAAKRPARSIVTKSQASIIYELAVGYIVTSNSPFTTFENPSLKALLFRFDGRLARDVPLGRNIITRELQKIYEDRRRDIREAIAKASTAIHISFDCWTSPDQLAMIAIIAHYLDDKYTYQTRLPALRRHHGDHSGPNMAVTIEKVIREWGIGKNIGVCICDNVSSNDTCLGALYLSLNSRFNLQDVKHSRTRCFGHILNLGAKAFLFGDHPDSFELAADQLELLDDQEDALNHWRRKGPVGKLHNIVKFIRASPQRIEAFKKVEFEGEEADQPEIFILNSPSNAELSLRQNNATRWNSTYLMIERAWDKHAQIQTYLANLSFGPAAGRLPSEDHLHPDDWRVLREVHQALKPIYELTMWAEARNDRGGRGELYTVQTGI